MLKAIIFDCFGVLAIDSWLPFKDEYFGSDPKLMRAATDLNRQANAGLIDYPEFIKQVATLAGITEEDASQQIGWNPANKPLFHYIEERLKPVYMLGILSNASADWMDKLFTPDQIGLFDAIVLSYQIGATKPSPDAYQAVLDKLGVDAEQSVLIDDQQRCCDGAREMGIKTILYSNFKQFKAELEQIIP